MLQCLDEIITIYPELDTTATLCTDACNIKILLVNQLVFQCSIHHASVFKGSAMSTSKLLRVPLSLITLY